MLLTTHNLTAFYGDFQALFGIDFEVNEAEIVAIIGANGAGKSTFLKTLTGDMPEAIRKRRLAIDVYFDEYHEADRAFDAYGFPIYCVVDAHGTIRLKEM